MTRCSRRTRHQAPQPRRHRRPREGRGTRACSARSAWATTTGRSRRSASRRAGTRSPPATCRLDRLAKAVKNGVHAGGGFPLEFGTISVSDGISHGPRGHALLPRQPRGHRRLGRDRDDGRAPRRLGAARRLRQVAARDAHGRRAARPRQRLPLRRHDHARPGRRQATSRSSTPSRPSAPAWRARSPARRSTRSSGRSVRARAPAAACTPPTRWPASPRRSACPCPAARRAAGGRPPPRRLRPQVRRGRRQHAPPGHHRPPDHDPAGLRERDRDGDGARRLDQRRPPPAGHRPRGRGRPDARRLQPHRRQGPAPRPT